MKTIIITSEQNKRYLHTLIDETPLDGSVSVEVKKTKNDSTSKQRRLNWLWCTEIANSGIGGYDVKMDVHIFNKYKFGIPVIYNSDDATSEVFIIAFEGFKDIVDKSIHRSAMYKTFCAEYIRTEKFTKHQRATYLSDLQRYWISKGVNLSDPALQGLDPDKLF